jgi:glycogen debranching enzyme
MVHRLPRRRWSFVCGFAVALVGVALPADAATESARGAQGATLDALATPVSSAENRAVSFTNKRSAFYYTQTHRNDHPEHAHFRGLNIAGRRIFNDYQLLIDGQPLDPQTATVSVRPDALVRTYPNGIVESLRLVDQQDIVDVSVEATAGAVQLRLSGDNLEPTGAAAGVDLYVSAAPGATVPPDHLAVARSGNRFLVAVAPSQEAARKLAAAAALNAADWQAQRRVRLESVIGGSHYLWTDDVELTSILRLVQLSTDSLVTQQRGHGIYAGLPWFNEYWGRDTFISLPGATLVTGHFEEARAILVSFAHFQELDRSSPFFGRLPNIVKPGSIDYHTTDGTPRWVVALHDYVRYSGDRSIVAELFPNVKASIEGALANFTDASGYLVHADNETWMDARREPDKVSYSPRSTRANDIQALWYGQLRAGAGFATMIGDDSAAQRWSQAAEQLRARFEQDFLDADAARVADHLDAKDNPNFQLRPNALFALDMLATTEIAARVLRRSWESLVYPWGVATLDPGDANFHPYHLAPGRYHKDAAYHNGTVWPWLNGIAMQRMLEFGQTELAWRLFQNTNAIALQRGVVGGLPENLDAYPHPGEPAPRLTGTYLQAWSNAEHLRLWYQGFLGIQPDLEQGVVRLAPRLPADLGEVEFNSRVGAGTLLARYERNADGRRYTWHLEGVSAKVQLDIAPFATRTFPCDKGDSLVIDQRAQRLVALQLGADGREKLRFTFAVDPERQQRQARLDAILAGTRFATPGRADQHAVMRHQMTR